MNYYVAKTGLDSNSGTEQAPFLTINHAAKIARAGDVVTVSEGVYREHVDPVNSGLSERRRIIFRAATGAKVTVKGSEIVAGWKVYQENVYVAEINNQLFGDFNPFKEEIHGDWLVSPVDRVTHLGSLFVDDVAWYEAADLASLFAASSRTEVLNFMTNEKVPEIFPERTKYQWYAEVHEDKTLLYANFHELKPTDHLTEITVRPTVFYPTRTNRNYITVEGFELAQAATQWAAPTGNQQGLIGTHWSKGWIIRHNDIHDAKTNGVSVGTDYVTGDDHTTNRKDRSGYQYQIEAVMTALRDYGWKKERIGSHLIEKNIIHDCGQTGIVGHMGGAFSRIADNEIFNIGMMREFYGWEMAGIKLHAPIDTVIEHNFIHDSVLGTWLDWQIQGVRISRNIYMNNHRGISIEVCHGPFIVDNNIFDSSGTIEALSEGGAYIHNLIGGGLINKSVLGRSTPYHIPHSTEIAGFSIVYDGDNRYLNNIFNYTDMVTDEEQGTAQFNDYPESMDEFVDLVQNRREGFVNMVDFESTKQPVYVNNNAYMGDINSAQQEKNKLTIPTTLTFGVEQKIDGYYLNIDVPEALAEFSVPTLSSIELAPAHMADCEFEAADGREIRFDTDLLGNIEESRMAGPFGKLNSGKNCVKIWDTIESKK